MAGEPQPLPEVGGAQPSLAPLSPALGPAGSFFSFLRFYLFTFRERGGEGEGEGEKYQSVASHMPPTKYPTHTTQVCALTGNQTGNLFVRRLALDPLSHTSQAW